MVTACIGVIYRAPIKEHSALLPPLAQWFVTGGQVEERPSQWPAMVDVHHSDTDLLNCHLLLDVKEITAWHLGKKKLGQYYSGMTNTDNSGYWLNKGAKRRMTLCRVAPASCACIWLVLSFRRWGSFAYQVCSEHTRLSRRPSELTSQLESDTDWWWWGKEGSSAAYLVRGECGRQWPGAKVSSAPVPVWGPSACQSHILIANIIWIYTNEYKWLPGLHKLRVINYYRR